MQIGVVKSSVRRDGDTWGRMLDMLGYLEALCGQSGVNAPPGNKYNWIPYLTQ